VNTLDVTEAGVIRFDAQGLVPAIVQHATSGAVLMLGWMNAAALELTRRDGLVTFWSRSRSELWRKGETSGHVLRLVSMRLDCDADALLVLAEPDGPTCHTGTRTCWGDAPGAAVERLAFLPRLQQVLAERIATGGDASYTARLFADGPRRMAQKVGEEGVEVALAAVQGDDRALIGESADLLFHLMLLLKARGLDLESVVAELESRHRPKA
jgi:phosphoribosyl-AMP cyclohydrolase / phosphoribosyl-ATP pyrophosphohydrolase